MKTELILKFEWRASHSLSRYEKEHPHLWELRFAISGDPQKDGMIVDLVTVRTFVDALIAPLREIFLNHASPLTGDEAQLNPTCETLSSYFLGQLDRKLLSELRRGNPTIRFTWLEVAIFEIHGKEAGIEMGRVRRTL
jgi:6-pyruvoyl-tetrahydropterin synthase